MGGGAWMKRGAFLGAISALVAGAALLAACETVPAADAKPVAPPAAKPAAANAALAAAIAGTWRAPDDRARDQFRHPYETLSFFGVKASDVVVEITPGGGWYTAILAPYLARGGGAYVVGNADPAKLSDRGRANYDAFRARFADRSIFGDVQFSKFGLTEDGACPAGTADMVLTFRNVHNWMAADWAQKAFADMAKCLKPGGVLGVVEHRAADDSPFDPKASTGYVKTATVKDFAAKAGLVFEAASEINANPRDSRDHPFGVWTLPPVRQSSASGAADPAFDHSKYDAIGESDRMTLRFRKPAR